MPISPIARRGVCRSAAAPPSLLLFVAACGDDIAGPSDRVLVGQWGSDDAELVAIRAGAEIHFGCTYIAVGEPIEVRQDGSFRGEGRLYGSGLPSGGSEVKFSGSVAGAQLELRAPTRRGGQPETFLLQLNVRPSMETILCPR